MEAALRANEGALKAHAAGPAILTTIRQSRSLAIATAAATFENLRSRTMSTITDTAPRFDLTRTEQNRTGRSRQANAPRFGLPQRSGPFGVPSSTASPPIAIMST